MHILKNRLILLFFVASFCSLAMAQSIDSVEVSGSVQWNHAGIVGYPDELTAISATKAIYFTKVDAAGKYHLRLTAGSYTITPTRHYYWMGEEFIRIDHSLSNIVVQVPSYKNYTAPLLKLDTIALMHQLPAVGVAQNFTSKDAILVDDFIKKEMAFFEIPGASLAVIKGGRVIYSQTYGVSDLSSGIPVTSKTLFEAGSVTKPVFAFAVMRLIERGVLKLDQPLYESLPLEALSHDERYKMITVRHVLCHQTGLPNWAKPDSTGHFNLLFTPGTAFGYSGEGYEYLKSVVEHITGKNISQILEEELLTPLQLKDFYFTGSAEVKKISAHGHNDLKPSPIRLIQKPMMAFSLFTEARAFTAFMLALRNKKGLKTDTYDEMFRSQSMRKDGVHWGLGFELNNTPLGLSYGHSGSTSTGFICNFTFFPKLDMGYVFFTNSDMGAELSISLLSQFLITGKN
ncbi:MAG: serine hydrolase domain-containing protein [Agriterribacter sp.]